MQCALSARSRRNLEVRGSSPRLGTTRLIVATRRMQHLRPSPNASVNAQGVMALNTNAGRLRRRGGIEAFSHAPDRGAATINQFEPRESCRDGGFDRALTKAQLSDHVISRRRFGRFLVR